MSSTLIYACLCRVCKAGKLLLFLISSTTAPPPLHQDKTSFIADCCPSQLKANRLSSVVALRLSYLPCFSERLNCSSISLATELLNCPFHCTMNPCNQTSTPCTEPFIPFYYSCLLHHIFHFNPNW